MVQLMLCFGAACFDLGLGVAFPDIEVDSLPCQDVVERAACLQRVLGVPKLEDGPDLEKVVMGFP